MSINIDKIKQPLAVGIGKFQKNTYIKAISDSMVGLMAIMMISSIASLINSINIGGSQEFMYRIGLTALLSQINTMTISVVSLYVAFLVAYKLASAFKQDALNCGIIGLMSFLILTPLTSGESGSGFALDAFGSAGMFVAIISGLLGARLYILFVEKKLIVKMPDVVPPVVSKSFAAIIPGFLTALIMGLIFMLVSLTPYGDLTSLLYAYLQRPMLFLGSNIIAAMIIVAFIEFLWFFGIHGVLAVMPIMMLVYQEPQIANLEAFGAGNPLPYLFTTMFILGNRGARSFAVSLLCMFKSKSVHLKTVGKLGFVPSLFGISEPFRFGIPQVMNVRMLIPTVLTPPVAVFSAWVLTTIGFLPYHNGVNVPIGTPIIITGFFTHGWQGIVAQLVQLALVTLIYIPFIKSQDKVYLAEEKANEAEMGLEAAETTTKTKLRTN